MTTIKIRVGYEVELYENDFNAIVKEATNLGYGYSDAGPMETVRRLLEHEGYDVIENLRGTVPFKRIDVGQTVTR